MFGPELSEEAKSLMLEMYETFKKSETTKKEDQGIPSKWGVPVMFFSYADPKAERMKLTHSGSIVANLLEDLEKNSGE